MPNNFNIISGPTEMSEKDQVLANSYKNLLYFGRAFLPNDFLNKSTSPSFHFDVAEKLIST